MGKVIDVEFRANDRGRWCVRCDEPFPEGTAMCPRCGGELLSAARHREAEQWRARRKARRYVATGAGLALLIVAAVAWIVFGGGLARGDEKKLPAPAPAASGAPPATPATTTRKGPPTAAAALPADSAATTKKTPASPAPPADATATTKKTPASPAPPADATATTKKTPARNDKLVVIAPHPLDGGVPPESMTEPTTAPRPVRVRLLDGSTVVGTVLAEEVQALVVDCSLGQLSIPRARISLIAYDAAAGVGQKRAPVQQLDDEDKPTKKRSTQP